MSSDVVRVRAVEAEGVCLRLQMQIQREIRMQQNKVNRSLEATEQAMWEMRLPAEGVGRAADAAAAQSCAEEEETREERLSQAEKETEAL